MKHRVIAGMNTYGAILLGLAMCPWFSVAETRWCQVVAVGPGNKLSYPDIARRARVSGVVQSRMTFSTNRTVLSIDRVSGPTLLGDLLKQQLKSWKIKTNVEGDEPCQTLVVATFNLDGYSLWPRYAEKAFAPSMLDLSVSAEPFPVESIDTYD